MKNRIFKTSLFVLAFAAAGFAILLQRQARAGLELEAAELRRSNAALAPVREENTRLKAQAAAPRVEAVPVAAAVEAAPAAPAVENRDPTQDMVGAEQLQQAGFATPAAAFQTFIWAALKGREDVMAASLYLSETARAQLAGVHGGMDASGRKKFPTPESIAVTFMADEVLEKVLRLHITSVAETAPGEAKLTARVITRTGRTRSSSFPLRQVDGAWRIALSDGNVEGMIQSLRGKEP